MTDHQRDGETPKTNETPETDGGLETDERPETDDVSRTADSSPARVTDRRSFVGGLTAVIGAGLTGAAVLATAPEPSAAVDGDPAAFEAGDGPTVTSNDGRVESVYLSPRIEVSWRDFGDGVDEVSVTLAAGTADGVDRLYAETLSADDPDATPGDVASVDQFDGGSVAGSLELALERVDATERGERVTSAALSDETLAGGETATTTVDLVVRAEVVGGRDETTVVRTTTVDVAVENPDPDAAAGGDIGVDAV